MNELLFFLHIVCISAMTLIMLKLGSSALATFLCVQALLANLFVLKQITLFGLNATASDVYIIGSVLSLNLLQEYYGKEIARKVIWISFAILLFYTLTSQIHMWYLPNIHDFTQIHYATLLAYMPRLAFASITVYLIVQYFDTYFYGFLKKILHGNYLLVRNISSICVSQLLDTLLFSFLGLYGIIDNIIQVMIVSFAIKLSAIILIPTIVLLIKKKCNF